MSLCVRQLVLQLHQDGVTVGGVDLLGRVALGPAIQHQRRHQSGLEEGTGGSVLAEGGAVTGIVVGAGSIGEESGVGLGTVKAIRGDKLLSGPRRSGRNPICCGMREPDVRKGSRLRVTIDRPWRKEVGPKVRKGPTQSTMLRRASHTEMPFRTLG